MRITYRGNLTRTQKASSTWFQLANDYKNGLPIKDIINKYINPQTGRQYSRAYIYWVLKRVQKL